MYLFAKKYGVVLVMFFLLGSTVPIKAQQSDSVNIRCVSVDTSGAVTLTWVLPPAANLSADGWTSYTVQVSPTNLVGSYSALNLIPAITILQTSVTIPHNLLPASPNNQQLYFYITTNNANSQVYNSNIVSNIYASVYNANNRIAEISWNPVSTPLPQGSSSWYKIWREHDSTWTLVDSTQGISYNDTIKYCDSVLLSYQVQIADTPICISTSNVAKSNTKFIIGFNPSQIVMDTVSVNPDNSVDITWKKSSQKNVIGYIVYSVVPFITNNPIATVYGINTDSLMHCISGGNPSNTVLYFAVAALDSCGRLSAISNQQNTILLQVTPDVCSQSNALKWNAYIDIEGNNNGNGYGIGGYNVFRSANHGPFQLLASLDSHARTYTDTGLVVNDSLCYYVQVYDSAHVDTTASSNVVCDIIQTSFHPKNNYLRTATVILNTKSVEIVGYVDSTSRAAFYVFQRSEYPTGGFSTISTVNAPTNSDSVSYIDNGVNPDGRSYYYHILTLDSCNKAIDSTNIGQTMLLTAVGQPNGVNTLNWNDYGNWYAGPNYYMIYRSIDGTNYSLLSPTVPYAAAGENTFNDNVSDIIDGDGTFYYYVKAVEDTNLSYPYPFIDTSLSNVTEAYQAPTVFIPDAFCPTGKNKIFIPVGVYISPQGYDLSILDRWGDIVFESTNPTVGWDGSYKGGKIVQEGVYVYLLTYTSSRGEYFQRKGTVTLIK